MGHLKEKYNEEYFLGSVDSSTGRTYGVLGHDEFKMGKIHDRLLKEFEITQSMIGSLEGKDILEIGFGRGDFIPLFLNAKIATYTGIDFSESAVQIAREHFEDSRLRLFQMEAKDLDGEHIYDLIVMFDVIEHIPVFEMDVVWEKIKYLLKPGGYIVISTPIFDNPNLPDHTEMTPSVSGIHCNKQTLGTIVRTCLKHQFKVIYHNERTIGMIRARDLQCFEQEQKEEYLSVHNSILANFGISIFDRDDFTSDVEKLLVPGAGRVAMGCVAENHPKFLDQTLRLLQSVRWFGGSMAGVNFFVCVVDKLDEVYDQKFKQLGAFVRIVKRFSIDHGHSNKLRFLEIPEVKFYDTIILLDCDTVVVQDPHPFLDGAVFQAKIADMPTVTRSVFERVFKHFDIELPGEDYQCNPSGIPTIWYCNSGVLIFPQRVLQNFGESWARFNNELLKHLELLAPNSFFCDQVSLSLAYAKDKISFRELPVEMNFPLHLTHQEHTQTIFNCAPVILHYHDRVDAFGYLQPSPYPMAQQYIERFNNRLREDRRKNINDSVAQEDNVLFQPIFLIGCMRSGTTLLADTLGELDSIIHCPFELKHIWSQVGGVPMASAKTRDAVCPQLNEGDIEEGQAELLENAFLNEMAKYQDINKTQNNIFLNKNPHLCNKLPFVNKLFPDSRFIWIYRDLLSVVASLKSLFEDVCSRQQTWHYWPEPKINSTARCWEAFHFKAPPDYVERNRYFPGGDVRYLAEYWIENNKAASVFFKSLSASRGLIIKEEQLIKHPRNIISQCQAFLGLPNTQINIKDKMENNRNDLWISRLTSEELDLLSEFIRVHSRTIDRLFPSGPCSKNYIDMITTVQNKSKVYSSIIHNSTGFHERYAKDSFHRLTHPIYLVRHLIMKYIRNGK